ncbi:MAG: tRNA1(Val) (adenine(37)-N6)-methyltransferase [Campylobacterota bacterium]
MLLYQPQKGYCYNSDTHFLYEFICKNLKKYKNINGELLDIGSGSGILGLLVSRKYERLFLNQNEIQNVFQFFSQKNSFINGIKSKMYKGSLLDIDFEKKFDMCVSNPPFYHNNVIKSENENKKIARYTDSLPLEYFIEKVSKVLTNKGKFFFCYDSKQFPEIVVYLKKAKLNIESIQFVHPNSSKDATLVLIYARKNSKSLMKVMSPLTVFDNGEFTLEVKDIYKRTSTHSLKVDHEKISN